MNLLNLARWIKEHAISWGLLFFLYSILAVVLAAPLLELAMKLELSSFSVWLGVCALIGSALFVEWIPYSLFHFHWKVPFRSFLLDVYLQHEFRRLATWVGLAISIGLAVAVPGKWIDFWIFICLFPVLRAMFSIQAWRGIVHPFYKTTGPYRLMATLAVSQAIQLGIVFCSVLILRYFLYGAEFSFKKWVLLFSGSFCGVVSACAMAYEGDSGRPWLVQFMALGAGLLVGVIGLISYWTIPFVLYFYYKMLDSIGSRWKSIEVFHEDVIVR